MLSSRIERASALLSATRRVPVVVQSRTFIPSSMNDPAIMEEKYPEYPKLTEAEDPLQVS